MALTVLATAIKVHKDANCPHLKGAKPKVLPLSEVGTREPCRDCFPGLPIYNHGIRHVCKRCSPTMLAPCAHNGGVKIVRPRKGTKTGETFTWTWPERALFVKVVPHDA